MILASILAAAFIAAFRPAPAQGLVAVQISHDEWEIMEIPS